MNRSSSWVLFLVLPVLCASSPAASDESGRNIEFAAQHPLVRDALRERFLRARSFTDNFGRRRFQGNPAMLETWVDKASSSVFQEIDDKLTRLVQDLGAASSSLDRWKAGGAHDRAREESWRKDLKALSESADDLRGVLAGLLPEVESGPAADGDIGDSSSPAAAEQAMGRLETEVAEAVRQIGKYLFSTDQSVDLNELRRPGMLTSLESVRDGAHNLARKR